MPGGSALERLRAPVAAFVRRMQERHPRLLLVAMLLLLHVAALGGHTGPGARAFFVAHLGLALLWQPLVTGERRLRPAQIVLVAVLAAAAMARLNAWLLAFWTVVLAGLVASQVFAQQARWERRAHLAAFAYLVALLVLMVLPRLAPATALPPEITAGAGAVLLLLALAPVLLPADREPGEARQMVDVLYGLAVVLLLGTVVLGSFAAMTVAGLPYLSALAATVLTLAGGVLVLALATAPFGGAEALGALFSRYLLSIGLPLERWLDLLARHARWEPDPERFLAGAAESLTRLPWIAGVRWQAEGAAGSAGQLWGRSVAYEDARLRLAIHPRYALGPTLALHLQLLARLLGVLYAAKCDERRLRDLSYLRAVHETGARLSHDVKNLLQALAALAALAAEEREPARQLELLRAQLPAISERLAATLEKLREPASSGAPEFVPVRRWWEAFRQRHASDAIEFELGSAVPERLRVPQALFDTVAENLVSNALEKRRREPAIAVRVSLGADGGPRLQVCDGGSAMPPQVAQALFRAPLTSANGLGIGLYHSARLAESFGFALRLETNRAGRVCFVLEPAEAQGSTPAEIIRA